MVIMLMLLSFSANAGMKGGVSFENTNSPNATQHVCKQTGPYSTSCHNDESKNNTNSIRGSIGFETQGVIGLDLNLSTNLSGNGRVDSNVIYTVNDKVKVKAGPNYTKQLYSNALGPKPSYEGGVGFQVGGEYKLTEKVSLSGQVGKTNQTLQYDGFSDKIKLDSTVTSVGVVFRF